MKNTTTIAQPTEKMLEAMFNKMSKHQWLPEDLLNLAMQVSRLQEETLCQLAAGAAPDWADAPLATQEAHYQGQALLAPEFFPYDEVGAAQLWQALLDLSAARQGPMQAAATALHKAQSASAPLTACDTFAALVRGDTDFFTFWAKRLPEAPAMVRFLAQASLTPWLTHASQHLQGFAADKVWEFGHCPHCGNLPYIGQLRGKEGARWHVCSFCQWSYRAPRLQCPVCQEKDTDKLHFFVTSETPGYEVHVCESCKNYLKLSDWRERDSTLYTPGLEDLDSLPLDLAARQQGYVRNTLSAWGF